MYFLFVIVSTRNITEYSVIMLFSVVSGPRTGGNVIRPKRRGQKLNKGNWSSFSNTLQVYLEQEICFFLIIL